MMKNMKIYETDFGIRFILFWNGLRIPFREKSLKFMKWNSWFVSENYETDPKSRFIKKTWKLLKRISRSVLYFSETNHEFRFWKKIKKYQTDFEIHFAFFLKRITKSVSQNKKEKKYNERMKGPPWLNTNLGPGTTFKERMKHRKEN